MAPFATKLAVGSVGDVVRIGMICPYSLSLPGGVQGQVLGLARMLRAAGHPTRVLGPCDGPPPDAGVTPLGDSLPTAANGSMAPIAPDVSCALRTIRALRDEDFDVLHLHEPLAPGPTTTALFLAQSPMVGTFHAAGGSRAYDLLNRPVRWLSRRMDRVFAVSDDAAAMAHASLGGEYEVLFNGVDVQRSQQVEPWPTDRPTVFFIGRHEPRKGLAVLLDAMAGLDHNVRLWVAGDGPETDELQDRVAGDSRVQWLGRISDAERTARISGAHVFCAPSLRGESFGVVLLEGMACGTPVVASDIPGYGKVARGGDDALLVPAGDAGALSSAIMRVLADPVLAARLVASGRQRAEEFSMRRLADRYLEAYASVMGTPDVGTRA
jgi:phosphatidylinositol alpha-mannosyltransferase